MKEHMDPDKMILRRAGESRSSALAAKNGVTSMITAVDELMQHCKRIGLRRSRLMSSFYRFHRRNPHLLDFLLQPYELISSLCLAAMPRVFCLTAQPLPLGFGHPPWKDQSQNVDRTKNHGGIGHATKRLDDGAGDNREKPGNQPRCVEDEAYCG